MGSKAARLLRPEVGAFEGEVLNGELTDGKLQYLDGRVYDGQWKNVREKREIRRHRDRAETERKERDREREKRERRDFETEIEKGPETDRDRERCRD